MEEEIRIRCDEVEEAVTQLETAMNEFEPYSNGFVTNAEEEVADFQSDFMDIMEELLGNMSDSKAPKLLDNIRTFIQEARIYQKMFREADEAIGRELE